MTMITKYDLDQTVWFDDFMGRAVCGTIGYIRIERDRNGIVTIYYRLYCPGIVSPYVKEEDVRLQEQKSNSAIN